jgi:hypothetical protein
MRSLTAPVAAIVDAVADRFRRAQRARLQAAVARDAPGVMPKA